jgi:predicted phosphoribosyltransferase
MAFMNREAAGRMLAEALERYRGPDVVVFALPRGGVPVAAEVGRYLGAPVDLLLVRKIGMPYQPEFALGAVVDGSRPVVVRNDDVIALAGVSEATFDAIRREEVAEIERRRARYLRGRAPIDVRDKTAIIVDDGIATGATIRAGIEGLRLRGPRRIVLAVPVGPADVVDGLRSVADDVICLETPTDFHALSPYYEDFHQMSDDEVVDLLDEASPSPTRKDV